MGNVIVSLVSKAQNAKKKSLAQRTAVDMEFANMDNVTATPDTQETHVQELFRVQGTVEVMVLAKTVNAIVIQALEVPTVQLN